MAVAPFSFYSGRICPIPQTVFHVKQLERELFLFGFHFGLELSIASVHSVTDCLEHILNLFLRVFVITGCAVAQDVQLVNDSIDTRACDTDKLSILLSFSGMLTLVFAIVHSPFNIKYVRADSRRPTASFACRITTCGGISFCLAPSLGLRLWTRAFNG
jgi:hypothetical protein